MERTAALVCILMHLQAYGFGGVGIIINALTDNSNRANAEIRTAARKADLKMASSGSVLFNFDRKGKLEVQGTVDEELVIETAIEKDIDDAAVVPGIEDNTSWVLTSIEKLSTLTEALAEKGITGTSTLAFVPKMTVECSDEDYDKNMEAVAMLEELDDVDSVDLNMSMHSEDQEA
jgi:transcriptional/translational regulatory protein YebC/TACO1